MTGRVAGRTRRNLIGIGGAILLVAVLSAGCGSGSSSEHVALARGNRCPASPGLVPSCGVWWGYSASDTSPAALDAVQRELGRRFDLVYRFHDLDDDVPTADERALADSGTLLHLSLVPRDFSDPTGALIPWRRIADGEYDEALRRQAEGIAGLGTQVFVTFDHEPDQPRKGVAGTAADFRAAWRHVHDLFVGAGATNAVWVWVVLGWQQTFERAATLWPGNDVVDWISWDVYNAEGCRSGRIDSSLRQTFAQGVDGFYDWLRANGPRYDIDTSLPMMISEAGSTLQAGSATADWYAAIPAVLRSHPQIKAVTLWSAVGNGTCDYRFTRSAGVTAKVRAAGLVPWLTSHTGPTPSASF